MVRAFVVVASFVASLLVAPFAQAQVSYSGIYPHLAALGNNGNEQGIGAVVAWQGKLYYTSYGPHYPNGSNDKLWIVDSALTRTTFAGSVGGTPANRLVHAGSNQLFIGPYVVDAAGNIRVVSPATMPGRLTATAPHLTDPNKVYMWTMEEGLYTVDVNTLAVATLHQDLNTAGGSSIIPGQHGKGAYTGQGVFVVSNNGYGGALAEWNGSGNPALSSAWTIVDANKYTEVTGPGGIAGTPGTPIWALGWDANSLLLNVRSGGTWTRYRLPKASYTHDADHGWYTEWPRIRNVGLSSGKRLLDMHGMWFALPATFAPGADTGLLPISRHQQMMVDAEQWNGGIVFAKDDASKLSNSLVGLSNSNLWFTDEATITALNHPEGWGGPWLNTAVSANALSEKYLFAGFNKRVLHLANTGASSTTFTVYLDGATYTTATVGAGGYTWIVFPPGTPGQWLTVRSSAATTVTAYAHYSDVATTTDASAIALLPGIGEVVPRSQGVLRTMPDGKLEYAVDFIDRNGVQTGTGYYQVDADMAIVPVADAAASSALRAGAAISVDVGADAASLLVTDHTGATLRLPRAALQFDFDKRRGIREVVTERSLLYAGGVIYELPRNDSGGLRKIKPISAPLADITDFASWRGMLVISGATDVLASDGHFVPSADGLTGLWFGNVDDLWRFGAPQGIGGPWLDTVVAANTASDPYLMTGFDQKVLRLSHASASSVTFTVEVDVTGNNEWRTYGTYPVAAGSTFTHTFPDGYSAHWVRVKTNAATTATAQLVYGNPPALNVLANGNFESAPFATGWANTVAVADAASPIAGTTSARFDSGTTGTLSQELSRIRSDFVLDLQFRQGGAASGRTLDAGLWTGAQQSLGLRVNVQGTPGIDDDTLQVFNGTQWVNVSAPGHFASATQPYRIRVIARGWGTAAANYSVYWSNAGGADFPNSATGLTTFQNTAVLSRGLDQVRFSRVATGETWWLDTVQLGPVSKLADLGPADNLLVNGYFDLAPFPTGWTNTVATGDIGNVLSGMRSAKFSQGLTGDLDQALPTPLGDFEISFTTQHAFATVGRTMNLALRTGALDGVNLRVLVQPVGGIDDDTLQAFDGTNWVTISPAGAFASAAVNYRIKVVGRNWGTASARYDVLWSAPGSDVLAYSATNLAVFASAAPLTTRLDTIRFTRPTGVANGDTWWVDAVYLRNTATFTDGFESGNFTVGGWTTSGTAAVSTSAKSTGSYGARLSSTGSITKTRSTVGFASVQLRYTRKTNASLDAGENLYIEWFNGSTWQVLETVGNNQAWASKAYTLPAGAANNAAFAFRFRTNANSSTEQADIDNVELVGTP
jgi:hypothetical protein